MKALQKYNLLFGFFFTVTCLALAISFNIELFSKIYPCRICNWQRGIYFFVSFISFVGIFAHNKEIISRVLLFAFTISVLLSLYHIAIQLGYLADSCSTVIPKNSSDFRQILFVKKVSCSETHKFFGVLISGWSFLLSLICFTGVSYSFCFSRKSLNSQE